MQQGRYSITGTYKDKPQSKNQQTWTEAVGSVLCRAALAAHIKAVPGAAMLVAAWCQHPKLAKVGCSE